MFVRLLLGAAATGVFLSAFPAVIVFPVFDFGRYSLPVEAQLLALAATLLSAPVAYLSLLPIIRRFPGGIRIIVHRA